MSDTFIRKDIIYLYKKLANINSTEEQLIFLEWEKIIVERIFNCLNEKRISLFNYIIYNKNYLTGINCHEVFHVSVFIEKIVRKANFKYRNSFGGFSFIYRNRINNYVLYKKYHNYFLNLYRDYIQIIDKEISICNEKLRLGFHSTEPEKYLNYLGKIKKTKNKNYSLNANKECDKIVNLKRDEFSLNTNSEKRDDDYNIFFINAKTLARELRKVLKDSDKIIFLLELKKNIIKVLYGLADISKATLEQLRTKKMELQSYSPEALYYLEFQIEQHDKKYNGKNNLSVDHLFVHVKRKIHELEKLNTIVINEIDFLEKKVKILKKSKDYGKGEKNSESEKMGNYGERDPYKFNNNKKLGNKKIWNGTKGEFASYVNDYYLDNQSKYNSLRDASNYLFEKYRFKWSDWTKEMCYDYVKKK